MPRKILYIHGVSVYGGSTRSLLEMLKSLTREEVEPLVICPRGQAADILERNGVDVHKVSGVASFDHTQIGYYRGLRWLILLRTFLYLVPTILVLRKVLKIKKWDLIHINDGTLLIPGLIALFTKLPIVWHFRTVMNTNGWRWKAVRRLVNAAATRVIAIDSRVARSLVGINNVSTVHNCVPLPDKDTTENSISKKSLGFSDDTVLFAMLGIMIPYKGIYEFLESAKKSLGVSNKIGFIYVGGNARPDEYYQTVIGRLMNKIGFSSNHKKVIKEKIRDYGIEDQVKIIEFTTDTNSIYKLIDVLCFPSHLDAIGRPAFEAAMYGKPSIAALTENSDDFPLHNFEGVIVNPGSVTDLSDAICQLAGDSQFRKTLGENARARANNEYACCATREQILGLYENAIQAS